MARNGRAWSDEDIKRLKAEILALMVQGSNGERGLFFSHACKAVGVDQVTGYQWQEKDEDFRQAVVDARQKVIESALDSAELTLMDMVDNKNLGAVAFLLKTQGKTRGYVEKQVVENTHTHQISTDINDVARKLWFALESARRSGAIIEGEAVPITGLVEAVAPAAPVVERAKAKGMSKADRIKAKKDRKKNASA